MYDHDASLRRWMQRSRMLTALADKQLVSDMDIFCYLYICTGVGAFIFIINNIELNHL